MNRIISTRDTSVEVADATVDETTLLRYCGSIKEGVAKAVNADSDPIELNNTISNGRGDIRCTGSKLKRFTT